jgi:diaminopimelate decarboxylase
LDEIAVEGELPEPAIGDLVAVTRAGAYGKTMSPLGFLSRPEPRELVREGGAIRESL